MDADGDLLAVAEWTCAGTPAGLAGSPEELAGLALSWIPAEVPGTVAGALCAAGEAEPGSAQLDAGDWWFRCRFAAPAGVGRPAGPDGGWSLSLGGLATLADVWLDGRHLLRSESMFTSRTVPVECLGGEHELCIRFAALAPELDRRRPRPRWKTGAATSQNLRWVRTTLLGRQPGWTVTPAPVGPWRPVRLTPRPPVAVVRRRVAASCTVESEGRVSGTVRVDLGLDVDPGQGPEAQPIEATLVVGSRAAPLETSEDDGLLTLRGAVTLDEVERWWPHTHGPQPLYPVRADVGTATLDLGTVGFRTVEADRSDGGFRLSVNGVPVFCRGACWYPIDPVGFVVPDDEVLRTIALARAAGMNMLRVPGGTVWEDERFFEACDRAGILVWQDAMLGFLDPPADEAFTATLVAEVEDRLSGAASHPSLAVFCGGQELEEQGAMQGLPPERWATPLVDDLLPAVVEGLSPGMVTLPSSPTGGQPPFRVDTGVSHYVGVGVFLQPLGDLRRSAPRFVSEGLAFAIPPERATVDELCGGAARAGHDPGWKRAIHHDTGGSWDLEDVRDHYVQALFGVDPAVLRRTDPERALDLGRATVCEVMAQAAAEWRRPGSPCDGFLGLALRDLRAGAGWGQLDALGRPKASWFALARAFRPVAVLATDEGLNGVALHLVNDTGAPVEATLVVGLHTAAHLVEEGSRRVSIPSRGGIEVPADSLFDGFRDLAYAYRFGPRPYELVTADLVDDAGGVLASTGFLPGGPARSVEADVGLQVGLEPADGGEWSLSIAARRFSLYVHVDVPGFRPDDSWFHLRPDGSRVVTLVPEPGAGPEPRGRVRALNAQNEARVST